MILSHKGILQGIKQGTVDISPFNESNLGANSYDVSLNAHLLVYSSERLDCRNENKTEEFIIPASGFVLYPGELYLGRTNETACSKAFVPMYEGRSSIGRLGISSHITAGFGDIGWGYDKDGNCLFPTWTLEITVVKEVVVYPNIRIGQVYFVSTDDSSFMYQGKYSQQKETQASLSFRDKEFLDK
jgi:dCTP deaminase